MLDTIHFSVCYSRTLQLCADLLQDMDKILVYFKLYEQCEGSGRIVIDLNSDRIPMDKSDDLFAFMEAVTVRRGPQENFKRSTCLSVYISSQAGQEVMLDPEEILSSHLSSHQRPFIVVIGRQRPKMDGAYVIRATYWAHAAFCNTQSTCRVL